MSLKFQVGRPFEAMQMAVDVVQSSPHPTHKIGAALIGWNRENQEELTSACNHWPQAIDEKIGRDVRIGNSSGTIHAEVAVILSSFKTDGGMLFVTDPPCPNCVKNMVEAGIRTLYIDHKGFEKAYMNENHTHVEDMSLEIARRAGMGVFKIFRKDQKIETLVTQAQDRDITEENPLSEIRIEETDDIQKRLDNLITALKQTGFNAQRFAACTIRTTENKRFLWLAEPHHVLGSQTTNDKATNNKYSFTVEPITRLLMSARKQGVTIEPNSVIAYQVPSSRELVNFVAANLTHLQVHNAQEGRDDDALEALKILTTRKVIIAR